MFLPLPLVSHAGVHLHWVKPSQHLNCAGNVDGPCRRARAGYEACVVEREGFVEDQLLEVSGMTKSTAGKSERY
jgi:hypothetical protein